MPKPWPANQLYHSRIDVAVELIDGGWLTEIGSLPFSVARPIPASVGTISERVQFSQICGI